MHSGGHVNEGFNFWGRPERESLSSALQKGQYSSCSFFLFFVVVKIFSLPDGDQDPGKIVSQPRQLLPAPTTAATAAASSNDDTCELPHKEEEEQKVSMQSQVYFMIGCQRSGSNWLRTMLSEREDLIAPHPPHIMREFMPQLKKFGDLTLQKNLRVCILPLYLIECCQFSCYWW